LDRRIVTRREDLLRELESWLGTRWIHGQCRKQVGTDCVQYLISVAKKLGWISKDYKPPKYRRQTALHTSKDILVTEIMKFCFPVRYRDLRIGDIPLYNYGRAAHHAGIVINDREMIHAHIRNGVYRTAISSHDRNFHSAWRPKGVEIV
jgi:cell wall-associated NlpC family hydrolase